MANSFLWTSTVNNIYLIVFIELNLLWYFATEMKKKLHQLPFFSIFQLTFVGNFFLSLNPWEFTCLFYVVVAAVNVFQTRSRCIFNARQKSITVAFETRVCIFKWGETYLEGDGEEFYF